MIRAHVHFPTYHENTQPLTTHFKPESMRPSMVMVYKPNARGKLVLVEAVLPKAAIRGPGRPRKD